jgi:hypothetical protein
VVLNKDGEKRHRRAKTPRASLVTFSLDDSTRIIGMATHGMLALQKYMLLVFDWRL